jgi:hypothetical protein
MNKDFTKIRHKIYYFSEYSANSFFKNLTGLDLAIKDLRNIKILQIEEEKGEYANEISRKLEEEFDGKAEHYEDIIPVLGPRQIGGIETHIRMTIRNIAYTIIGRGVEQLYRDSPDLVIVKTDKKA